MEQFGLWTRTLLMHPAWPRTVSKIDWIKVDAQGRVSSWTNPLNPRPCHVGWPQDKAAQGKHKVSTMATSMGARRSVCVRDIPLTLCTILAKSVQQFWRRCLPNRQKWNLIPSITMGDKNSTQLPLQHFFDAHVITNQVVFIAQYTKRVFTVVRRPNIPYC